MKIEEIMVGDYLKITEPDKFAGFIGSVQNIGGPSKYLTMYLEPYHNVAVFIEDVEGIPLTPEILEKNGFDISDPEVKQYHFEEDGQRYHFSLRQMYNQKDGKPNGYSFFAFSILTIIDYVHELQHALRLCGIEKEIKL